MHGKIRALLGAVFALGVNAQAFALGGGGYSSELISIRSLGQGDTGVAGVSDDPMVAYTNPAALTDIKGNRLNFGLAYVNVQPTFTDTAGNLAGARATSVVVPNFAISSLVMDGKLGMGLSVTSPYGLESHWNPDGPLRYIATDARLGLVMLSPALGYKVSDKLSVGIGADYANVLEGQLDKQIPTGTAVDGSSRFNANGDGWGYHFGVKYKPTEHHAIGLVYHSRMKVSLKGNLQLTNLSGLPAFLFGGPSFTTNAQAPLYLPQNVQLGYAFMPNDQWQFEINGAWYDWSIARSLGIVYTDNLNAFQSAALSANNPSNFGNRKTLNCGIGANYKQNDKLQWRAGGWYQGASQAENGFSPAFTDEPRLAMTAGTTIALTPKVGLDLGGAYSWFHTRYINNTSNGGIPLTGSFRDHSYVLAAAVMVKLPDWGGSK